MQEETRSSSSKRQKIKKTVFTNKSSIFYSETFVSLSFFHLKTNRYDPFPIFKKGKWFDVER